MLTIKYLLLCSGDFSRKQNSKWLIIKRLWKRGLTEGGGESVEGRRIAGGEKFDGGRSAGQAGG